jgi:hypothetical protein
VFVAMSGAAKQTIYAQRKINLSGVILNSVTKKPVEFATITVLEARIKGRADLNGNYSIDLPKAGTYTVIVRSSGLGALNTSLVITKSLKKDFFLNPIRMKGAGITVTDDRYIQKVSRRTMTRDDLKNTPASFGDAVGALTSLPGVDRTSGFFGPLVIRGMDPSANRYYIDGMLVYDPMHFGGLHSIINTNLMDKIDLYASALPNSFGGPTAAVIDIKTVDDVKEFGGYVDVGLLSTAALLQTPFSREVYDGDNIKEENAGYIIASGRYSTFENMVNLYKLYNKARGKDTDLEEIPAYYDYQLKMKYYIDNENSVSMLFFGGKDWYKTTTDATERSVEDGADPLLQDIDFDFSYIYNSLGLYYDYRRDKFRNQIMVYVSVKNTHNYINSNNAESADWMKGYGNDIKPNIYGLKDNFALEWIEDHAELKGTLEYTLYDFKATGKQYTLNEAGSGFDPGNDNFVVIVPLDIDEKNHIIGGYLDNKFTFGGLTFVPGVRADHFEKIEKTTVDPRGLVSYEFPTNTTISVAGGKYSSFVQVNPFFFNYIPAGATYYNLKPERAYHSIVGIEQELGLFTFEIEGYYNYFYDQAQLYRHKDASGDLQYATSSGKAKVYGFEIMLRKDKQENTNDYFGWLSYTYNRAKTKSGITGNIYDNAGNPTAVRFDDSGHKWINSMYEREHSLKLVLGYTYGKHTISGKFQLYSSFPYTPIVGSQLDTGYTGSPSRYTPVYDENNPNSKHFPISNRLDLRYSYKTGYEWGYISWYLEVINVTKRAPVTAEDWKYNQPYAEGSNPKHESPEGSLDAMIIPNFGVEVKF